MKENNAAALASIAKNDNAYKSEIRSHIQLAGDFYREFAGEWDKVIPDVGENICSIERISNQINSNLEKLVKISDNLFNLIQSKTNWLLYCIGQSTDKHGLITADFWSQFNGTQEKMAEDTDKQKNVIEASLGDLPKPQEFIEEFSAEMADNTATALTNVQKQAAREEKSKGFAQSLTKPKQEIGVQKQSRWAMAKERAGKTADKTKEIVSGIGKVLKALLNPVALVAAFVSKFLPYILIFGAMLYGAWQGMGDELRERFKDVTEKILLWAGAVFLGWKIIPMIIKGLALIYQFMRIGFLMQEHTAIMSGEVQKVTLTTTEHTAKMGSVLKDIFFRVLEFVRKIFATLFDMLLRGLEFALKVAAIALGIILLAGLIILIVAGLGAVLFLLAKAALQLFGDLMNISLDIIKKAIDIIISIASFIFQGIGSILGGLFGDTDESEAEKNEDASWNNLLGSVILADSIEQLSEAIAGILEPISLVNTQLATLIIMQRDFYARAEQHLSDLGSAMGVGPFSSFSSNSRSSQNNMSMEVADSTTSLLNNEQNITEVYEEGNENVVTTLNAINENIKVIIGNQLAFATNGSLRRPVK